MNCMVLGFQEKCGIVGKTAFVEIDHEIISTVILLLSADSRRTFVTYKLKYTCTKYWLSFSQVTVLT